jgi:hypothetical protein
MNRKLMLAAAAGLLAASVVAAPADASPYRVIRWDVTGICQVWDFGFGPSPWPGDFRIVSKRKRTFEAALWAEHRLWHKGVCLW